MEFSEIDPDCMVAEDIIRHAQQQLLRVYDFSLPKRKIALDLLATIAEALLSMPAQERMDILEELSRRHD